jgi:hypothetical protein
VLRTVRGSLPDSRDLPSGKYCIMGNRTKRRGPLPFPEFDPKKTPRLRRGPRASCECDLPTCCQCRALAAKRRWYGRNRRSTIERTKANMKRWRAGQVASCVPDSELDRKALAMLAREGFR